MPGAKMIFNARYFHIAKPGESLSKNTLNKNAAAGLVNYIATRESVVHNFTPEYEFMNATDLQRAKIHEFVFDEPEVKQLKEFEQYRENPTAANATRFLTRASNVIAGIDTGEEVPIDNSSTEKQRERIEDFLAAVPELKETMEYKDYLQSPTFTNASEFLSNAFDNSLGSVVDPETLQTMVNYMATRPGVVKDGDHGLFSSDEITDLEAYKKEVSEHTGNIYSTVVSLRREDADALGFDSQENWKNTVRAKLDVVARNSGISLQDLRWCAAMHNTGHHPHIHFMYWSKNPNTQNYLSKQGIEKIKSAFAHEIFRGEFEQIYEVQKNLTHDLKEESSALLQKLNEHAADYANNYELIQKFSELSTDLSELQGKHQYKYLPKRIKLQVNELVDKIGEIPEIKRLHELYEENNNKMLSIYKESDNIPRRKLSEAKSGDNLYFLKNMVIKSAEALPLTQENLPEYEATPEAQDVESSPSYDMESILLVRQLEDLSASGDKEAALLLGDIYSEGISGVEADTDKAIMWYGIAANDYGGEPLPLAAYKLSEIMLNSAGSDINLAHEFAYRSMKGFMKELENSPNTKLIQDLSAGKYLYHDLESYHRQQFKKLKEILPHTEYEPPTVYQESPENAERLFYLGKLLAENHTFQPDFDSSITAGTPKDTDKAKSFYQFAFDAGHIPAAYELGLLEENLEQSLAYFLKGADAGDLSCTLEAAKRLETGQNGITDMELAGVLYQKAENLAVENPPDNRVAPNTAESILHEPVFSPEKTYGKTGSRQKDDNSSQLKQALTYYKKGTELAADKESRSQAFDYFKKSADLGYSWGQYKTAQYIYKGLTDLDRSEAHPYFQLARESFLQEEQSGKENDWRDYVTAGMYEKGLGTESSSELANRYYAKALASFIKEEGEHPKAWKESVIAKMYEKGLGTVPDPEKAFTYHKKAADNGHTPSAYKVGEAYRNGKGVPVNELLSQRYFKKAFDGFMKQEQENPNAYTEYQLGRMFHKGFGVEKNLEQAKEWYQKSADKGNEYAKEALDRLNNQQNSQEQHSSPDISSVLQSLIRTAAAQMHQENLQSQKHHPSVDRKERRKIREKKHEMGLKEDWEQSLE
ncbi:MobP3 family relaxase [Scatolibacter rhodanostii]|uniref:MobP3 family relaxase n=1 Tax=Scatolibacter rhodanostii TaxID=2014781 RepID=UPI000C07D513|nr:MobP3 family relaxase [Scatolibacter rhodanostii]